MADVKKIRVYVVSGKEGPAFFEHVYEGNVGQGADYQDIIEKLARDDGWDQGFAAGLHDVSDEHIGKQTAGRDGLNIHLPNADDPIAIAICLPKHDKNNQLEFRDKPIIELWTNSWTGETFIASEHTHQAGQHRWASFVCNPKEARDGKLAKYIGDLPDDRFGGHKGAMRIPFTYNFVDERMKFAPWVLSDHSHEKGILTHGGVHPYSSYYLTIDLQTPLA